MLREVKASNKKTVNKYVEYASGLLRRLSSSIVELHISQDQLLNFINACKKNIVPAQPSAQEVAKNVSQANFSEPIHRRPGGSRVVGMVNENASSAGGRRSPNAPPVGGKMVAGEGLEPPTSGL
jgi:hypothetical protein